MFNFFIPSAFLLSQERNNTAKAGEERGEPLQFGPNGRYRLISTHSRWEESEAWFVEDTEQVDEDGLWVTVSQGDTADEALAKAWRRL